jgi:hypothetical protein
MKQVYAIAEDVWIIENGENVTETRVAHNLGVFTNEEDAQKRCKELNDEAQMEDEELSEENTEMWEDTYYVLPLTVK